LPDLPSDSVVDLPVDATPELAIHNIWQYLLKKE
jgi:hypothetical protein